MAKRGQNEGSIYKRADGRWASAISLGFQDGKPKRKTFYGATRKEVQEKLNVALRDFQQGLPVNLDERQTVSQFLDRWLTDCVKPSVRPKTYSSYSQLIRLYIKPKLGRIALTKLTPQHVQTMMNELMEKGLSPRTTLYTRTVLRKALGQALKWALVGRNVATLVDPPRYKRPEIVPLSPEQCRVFLKSIKGGRMEALYSVALALGLRIGEATGLRWQDIDFDKRTLRVNVALQRIEGKLELTEPKTERSKRTLPLPETIVSSLQTHRIRQLEERLSAGKKWQDTGFVFTTLIGTPLDARNVLRWFKVAIKNAKLPDQRFHDLRHSCASLLLAQGVPARTVMEILGHSQISLTMNTYSHVMPEMTRDAADLMDSILTAKK
ncbi:MAG: site-specific integrase [Acidobacteria bacterium]|nr:site-specific integrase [Acidobacteriota bacterium]